MLVIYWKILIFCVIRFFDNFINVCYMYVKIWFCMKYNGWYVLNEEEVFFLVVLKINKLFVIVNMGIC